MIERLTEREYQILCRLADGLSNREIASAVRVSEDGVKYHLKNIYGKLHANGRLHAVRISLDAGLLSLWQAS